MALTAVRLQIIFYRDQILFQYVILGLNSGLAPMYLTEIAPANLRGTLGSVNQLMVTVSILVANIVGFHHLLGTQMLWPVVLGMYEVIE